MDYDYPPEEDYEEPRILWGRVGVYAGSLLLAFILGSCLGGGGTGDLEDQLEAAESEAAQANQRAETAERQLDELSQRLATDEGDSAEDEGEGDADGDGATGTVADDDDGDATTADGERQHTVAEGETLTTIAQRFYGDPTAWPTIAEANDIDGTSISIGDVLIIPPAPDE